MFYFCTTYYNNLNIDYFIKTHTIPNNPKTEGDLKKFIRQEDFKDNVFIEFRKQIRQKRKGFCAFYI